MSKGELLVSAVRSALNDFTKANCNDQQQVLVFDPYTLEHHVYNTRLTPSIISMDGMSGIMFRIFINNLLNKSVISSYLELGCWTGSTAISALYNNSHIKTHWLIDNWSEWGGNGQTEKQFYKNWNAFITDRTPNLIDQDCFSIVPKDHGISNVDVYFCDGGNDSSDGRNTYKALTHFYDSMSYEFVFIVDDWWCRTPNDAPNDDFGSKIQKQTYKAISDLDLKVLLHFDMPQNNNTMSINGSGNKYGWWNGCGVFVLSK